MLQVTSTGSLGYEVRPDERAYLNFPQAVGVGNVADFQSTVETHLFGGKHPEDVTRTVARAVVDTVAFQKLLQNSLGRYVEAAAPIGSDGNELVAYFAHNAQERTVSDSERRDVLQKVEHAKVVAEAHRRQNGAYGVGRQPQLGDGLTLVDSIRDPKQLAELWNPAFGWTEEGCDELRELLRSSVDTEPGERSTWFRGIETESGLIVAAAMAERLDMPSAAGSVALVEHTEWAASPEHRGHGLGRGVVSALTATLKQDLADTRHVIYAECNVSSGAHQVALNSGMTVPEVEHPDGSVDQVFFNNIRIGDGQEPRNGYRNFMFAVVE